MTRRQGITLVEVLAAIGIMGIGMLAILVLFPLGALSMGRALKDDRCGTIAANADGLARALDYHNDAAFLARLEGNYTPPTPHGPPATPVPGPSDPGGVGYPLFIDPYFNRSVITPTTAGANPNPRPNEYLVYPTVPRVMPSEVPIAPVATRDAAIDNLFMFRDDMSFFENGYPKESSEGRYTWAYMLRRRLAAQPGSTDLTVIVYSGRSTEAPVAEETYAVTPDTVTPSSKGETGLTLTWAAGQERPALRRGHWLFDSTSVTSATRKNATGVPYGSVNARFYRVMDVSDDGTANQLRVEVQPPLQDDVVRQMTTMTGAVEVFDRGGR